MMDKSKLPKISVVTPSYNQGEFIEETILSVLDQDYPDIEYIIIDGGSTDASASIIQKYSSRLAYWVSEKDAGQSDAINKGFRKATGQICCYLNSDDLLLPGALSLVARSFMENDIVWLTGACLVGPRPGSAESSPARPETLARFINDMRITQQSTFWAGDALPKDYFDSSFRFRMDHDFFIRLYSKYGPPRVLKENLAFFRLHENAKTSTIWDVSLAEWKLLVDREKANTAGALHKDICHHEYLTVLHRQISDVLTGQGTKPAVLASLGGLVVRHPVLVRDRMMWGAVKKTLLS